MRYRVVDADKTVRQMGFRPRLVFRIEDHGVCVGDYVDRMFFTEQVTDCTKGRQDASGALLHVEPCIVREFQFPLGRSAKLPEFSLFIRF